MNISDKKKVYLDYLLIALTIVFNWSGACNTNKRGTTEIGDHHPVFNKFYLDKSERNKIRSDQCIIVGVDFRSIGFHISTAQCYKPPKNDQEPKKDPKDTKNYVKQLNELFHWFITPSYYGIWSYKPQEPSALEINTLIEHNLKKQQKKGITLEVINALYNIDLQKANDSPKDVIIVIGTGISGELYISEEAKIELQKWKENKKIGDYEIEKSDEAAKRHNYYVKNNKKVFTLLPLCC